MPQASDYLLDREWSMGNGQCPDCNGAPSRWFGHPCYMTPETIGHKLDCKLAASLKELGHTPLMIGDFKSEVKWEHYFSECGCLNTRPVKEGVTDDGGYREWADTMNRVFDDYVLKTLKGS